MKQKSSQVVAFLALFTLVFVPQAFADGAVPTQTATTSGTPVAGSGDLINGLLLSAFAIIAGLTVFFFSRQKNYQ